MKQQELFPDAVLHHRKYNKSKTFEDCHWYGKDEDGCGSSLWGTCLKKYDCGVDCTDDCNGLRSDGKTPCLFAKHHNLIQENRYESKNNKKATEKDTF
jgi:hypothetical protein